MPDAFFASTSKKRKRPYQSAVSQKTAQAAKGKRSSVSKKPGQERKGPRVDEELDSDGTHSNIDDIDLRAPEVDPAESDGEEDAYETPAEKRLRLAKIYLESVKEGIARGEDEFDAAEIDRNIISARLKEDVLENAGKLHIFLAGSLMIEDPPPRCLRIKGHGLPVTAAILSHDAKRLYVAGKDGGMSFWDVASGKRLWHTPKVRKQPPDGGSGSVRKRRGKGKEKAEANATTGHTDEILALALSGDGRYLASGGKDRVVGVWEVGGEDGTMEQSGRSDRLVWVKGFGGHKDTITALSFRKSTNVLYTASSDRTIKLFDLSPGVFGYIETLFGHQDSVTGLDSLKGDTAVSCGGRDRTCRFWKIAEETQLVFRGGGAGKTKVRDILEGDLEEEERGHKVAKGRESGHGWVEGSIDCVAMIDEKTFLSGGDSGTIALWSAVKKKPVFTCAEAHGLEEIESSTEGLLRRPRWITSISCLRYADLFASGSWDGSIRLWKLDASLRSFSRVGRIPAMGLINSLQLVLMPNDWCCDEAWCRVDVRSGSGGVAPALNGNSARHVGRGDEGVLIVAGVGQEPRLGRWLRLRGDGIANAAMVFSLRKKGS